MKKTLGFLWGDVNYFLLKEAERDLLWQVQIGDVGRWATLTVVCGWWLPDGTLTIKNDTRKTTKKNDETPPYSQMLGHRD